ncbi:metal-sulfur cluster biosynthetic enzyme [halophilic archaeon]|nr:metal-sulfur cluster biosynthetic enzyme [halophilic archaeon]
MTRFTDSVSESAVRERLDRVTDPELDESIVELQYIDQIHIDGHDVTVQFRLPTAWCSPAFAWMMATGIRDEVGSLPPVETIQIRLIDHMHEAEINRGVNERLAFDDVFEDAEDDITQVREELDQKARLARQYRAVNALRDAGLQPDQIVRLQRNDVTFQADGPPTTSGDREHAVVTVQDGGLHVSVPAAPLREYLEKATGTGIVASAEDVLFATPENDPIDVDNFEQVHARSRLAHTNMDGQGGICANLNESRYEDVSIPREG